MVGNECVLDLQEVTRTSSSPLTVVLFTWLTEKHLSKIHLESFNRSSCEIHLNKILDCIDKEKKSLGNYFED